MFIDPVDSYKLVKSVQRDYRKAAEDYRQIKEADILFKKGNYLC